MKVLAPDTTEIESDLASPYEWVEIAPGRRRLVPKGLTQAEARVRGRRRPSGVFPRGFSLIHGEKLTTWSEYRSANKRMGLVDVGAKPPELKPKQKIPNDIKPGRVVPIDE